MENPVKDVLTRWQFTLKTRLGVARSNFFVNRAFKPEASSLRPVLVRTAGVALLLLVIATGTTFMVSKSSATIPDIAGTAALPEPAPVVIEAHFSYTVVVDKAREELLVLKENDDYFDVIRSYKISLGGKTGAKEKEGDLKTPEGLYKIVEIKEDAELPTMYGPRAFVLNYPNSFDEAHGRTGGGIWLHGSGKGSKTPDTKGCVELDDWNIVELGEWIGVDTTVAIFPIGFELPVKDGKVEKQFLTRNFFYGDILQADSGML